jgi:hypothetical protein
VQVRAGLGATTPLAQDTSPGDGTDHLRLTWIPIRTMGNRLGRPRRYFYADSALWALLTFAPAFK